MTCRSPSFPRNATRFPSSLMETHQMASSRRLVHSPRTTRQPSPWREMYATYRPSGVKAGGMTMSAPSGMRTISRPGAAQETRRINQRGARMGSESEGQRARLCQLPVAFPEKGQRLLAPGLVVGVRRHRRLVVVKRRPGLAAGDRFQNLKQVVHAGFVRGHGHEVEVRDHPFLRFVEAELHGGPALFGEGFLELGEK